MSITAARLAAHGSLPQVEVVPAPQPRNGEVLVEMAVVALNPVDLSIAAGRVASHAALPRIVGLEGAGWLGDQAVVVCGCELGLTRDGTAASQIAAPRHAVLQIPSGVSLDQAAACGVAGATAVRAVELSEVAAGDVVLVLGAAGAVGSSICRLLQDADARILGQSRARDGAEVIERAGAEPLLAATPTDLPAALHGTNPSVIIDSLGADWTAAAIRLANPRGRVVIYGASAGAISNLDVLTLYRKSLSVRGYSGMTEDPGLFYDAVRRALDACATGHLSFSVHLHVGLNEIATAYRALATSPRGKVLVDVSVT